MGNVPSALQTAALRGDVAGVRVAVQQHPTELNNSDPTHGWTALHIAAARGFDVIVRELLAHGADFTIVDKVHRTPLHWAALQGHAGVVKDLLRHGGDASCLDRAGHSPLDLAAARQHALVAALLQDALAGRSGATHSGLSPTAWQVEAGQSTQQGMLPLVPNPAAPTWAGAQPQQQRAAADLSWLQTPPDETPDDGEPSAPPVPPEQLNDGMAHPRQEQPGREHNGYVQSLLQQEEQQPLRSRLQASSGGQGRGSSSSSSSVPARRYPPVPSATQSLPPATNSAELAMLQQHREHQQRQLQQLQQWSSSVDGGDDGGWGDHQQDDWGGEPDHSPQRGRGHDPAHGAAGVNVSVGDAVAGAGRAIGGVARGLVAGLVPLLSAMNPGGHDRQDPLHAEQPERQSGVVPPLPQSQPHMQLHQPHPAECSRVPSLSGQGSAPPSVFVCPITQDVMEDPVFATDGFTYERNAIAGWLAGHNTSPMTNLPLTRAELTPNLALRSAIRDWQDKVAHAAGSEGGH